MQMKTIRGKNIVEAGYEPVEGILAVRFLKSGTYSFKGVPENIWVSIQRHPFPDKYFSQVVKGKFPVDKPGKPAEEPKPPAVYDDRESYYITAHRELDQAAHFAVAKENRKEQIQAKREVEKERYKDMEFFRAEDGLTFTEEGHKYHLQGKPLISLTQILDASGLVDYSAVAPDVLANKAAFGTQVHEYTAWHDQDDLEPEDWAKLLAHPKYGPRLKGWVQFCEDFNFTPDQNWIEVPCAVKVNGMTWAMTIDRFGILGTPEDAVAGKAIPAVVEIKTGCDREPSHQIQTAGQAIPFRGDGSVPMKRYAVYLLDKANGAGKFYFAQEHTDRTDEKVFLCALTLTQFRINQKLLKG